MSRKKYTIEHFFYKRLKILIKNELKISQKAFADKIGISPNYLSFVLSGKRGASAELIAGLFIHYGKYANYVLTGKGSMGKPIYSQERIEPGKVAESRHGIVTEKILQMLEGMTEDEQRDILRYIEKEKLFRELMEEKKREVK